MEELCYSQQVQVIFVLLCMYIMTDVKEGIP